MPCPHANGGHDRGSDRRSAERPTDERTDERPDDEAISRRRLIRAAVAVGGASGLAACLDTELGRDSTRETAVSASTQTPTPSEQSIPQGPSDPSTLPERQHAWTDYLVTDRFGNTVLPQHQAFLALEYVGSVPPTEDERAQVARAFQTLERAYQRGTGGESSAVEHAGLLFAVGYAPAYFDRFDASLPAALDLPHPGDLLAEVDEPEPTADEFDAIVHMGSDYGSVLLATERALFGKLDEINGLAVEADLTGVFELAERRTGFIGRGQPVQRYDDDDIPDSAPLSMGFKSGFRDNLPTEDRVTIQGGPFAGGTTMQVSRLEHDLDTWYDSDRESRTHRMFSPDHTTEDVGEVGQDLASASGLSEETVERVDEDAEAGTPLGHAQKLGEARDEDFRQRILRRDFDIADTPGLHFDSWQREMNDFVAVRKAMNGDHVDADVDEADDGILSVIEVTNRATYLMPPRSMRALPTPNPDR